MIQHQIIVTILAIGVLIAVALFVKSLFSIISIPYITGFILLGAAVNYFCRFAPCLDQTGSSEKIFTFLADIGIIMLLFRIGLNSNLKGLLENLKSAGFVGITALLFSVFFGYLAGRFFLGLSQLASVSIAAALAATSVGIPASIWQEKGKIDTKPGRLFIDMAELDDIAGVIIMAMIFAVLTEKPETQQDVQLTAALKSLVLIIFKLIVFTILCFLASQYLEHPLTKKLHEIEKRPDPTLVVISLGIIISAIAAIIGFSLAIGAFFAGIIFSRDPDSIRDRTALDIICDLFIPFFFIHIGLQMDLAINIQILIFTLVILAAAIAGKFIGTFIPALPLTDKKTAITLATGMIPRAEITLIIAQTALNKDILNQNVYISIVFTVLITSIVPTLILRRQLQEI